MATRTATKQKNYKFCTCITHFCTFLWSCCTITTWNFLVKRFVEDVNTRQQLSFSSSELRYSPLELSLVAAVVVVVVAYSKTFYDACSANFIMITASIEHDIKLRSNCSFYLLQQKPQSLKICMKTLFVVVSLRENLDDDRLFSGYCLALFCSVFTAKWGSTQGGVK